MTNSATTYCGTIAIVGRPNVGKSTLLNHLIGEKLSITSRKPQTTRHNILGIHSTDTHQCVFLDTPGIHKAEKKIMNRLMNRAAFNSLVGVDMVAWVIESWHLTPEDEMILERIKRSEIPCVLVINKMDKLDFQEEVLPLIDVLKELHEFKAIVPISAKNGSQVAQLLKVFESFLAPGEFMYDQDQLTDRSIRFLCSEILREKIFRYCGQELPYAATVEIESYEEGDKLDRIHALIMVEKESHKRMIIGDKGQKLKTIATEARHDMERLINKKVFLQCFCKVKSGWSDNEQLLNQLGYGNF
jgi:GTP-binding protein Era